MENGSEQVYNGSTEGMFKSHYYNHRPSFKQEKCRNRAWLASYVKEVKEKNGKELYCRMGWGEENPCI